MEDWMHIQLYVASILLAELKAGVTDSSEMWIVVYEVHSSKVTWKPI